MGATIFVVDDDPGFVRQLDAAFEGTAHRVIGYVDGAEAIRHLDQLRDAVDVAIVDFVIRGTTGFELIGAIQRNMPRTKIIATLPPKGPDISHLARRVGADLVIRRPAAGQPIDHGRWREAVDSMIAESDPEDPGVKRL